MKLLASLVGLSAALVGLAAPLTSAWTITTTNATQPEEVLGPHQTFVKVWTVTGASPVGAIQLSAAGSVFIDYDANLNGAAATEAPKAEPATPAPTVTATQAPTEAPATEASISATTEAPARSGSGDEDPLDAAVSFAAAEGDKIVAKVSLSGNCTKLLDEIEVVQHDDQLKIRFKNTDFSGHGFILTEVVVGEKASLTKVSSSGSSGVYVGEGVFASSNTSAAEISVSGDADIFVAAPNTDFSLASLSVKVSGSGNIQFNAASLAVNESLWTKISGDATIAVVAKTIDVTDAINTKISGEGDVYIQADSVRAVELVSKISGDGDITVSTNGSCVSQDISISGQGNVATGSILSENTKLKMSGEGSVLVQTSGTFLVPHEIDGHVQYVGAPPQRITDGREPRTPRPTHPPRPHPKPHHGWYWGWWDDDSDDDSDDESEDEDDSRYLPNSVTAAPENTYKTYELREVPKREPTFLVLSINRNRWGPDPHERAVISILGWDIDIGDIDIGDGLLAAHTQRLAARVHKQHGPAGVAALGTLAIAVVAAACVAVHKAVVRRRRRREYQPLLAVVTN